MDKIWTRLVLWGLLLGFPSMAFADIDLPGFYTKNSPSVVTLTLYTEAGDPMGQTTGFILDKSGIIVTCFRALSRAGIIEVSCSDGTTHLATAVVSSDKDWDLALLQVDRLTLPPLKLGTADEIRIGAAVVAINPSDEANTICQGTIGGLHPLNGDSLLEINAPISPGSVGGPIMSPTTQDVLGMAALQGSGQNTTIAIPCTIIGGLLKSALATENPPERKLDDFTPEVKEAMMERKRLRDAVEAECTVADAQIINDGIETAIASGAGIYNGGDHRGCYRLYEGAAYKILYLLNGRSPSAITVLLTNALQKARTDDTPEADDSNAWLMRHAFDSIDGIKGHHISTRDSTPTIPVIIPVPATTPNSAQGTSADSKPI